jgi:mercuric ion transport protein
MTVTAPMWPKPGRICWQPSPKWGSPPRWLEWDRAEAATPLELRRYGSPTILINGCDVAGTEPASADSNCRLYGTPSGGLAGVPSMGLIAAALRSYHRPPTVTPLPPPRPGWRSSLGTLPGIGAALLPVGACPACITAYAGVFSALGLGALLQTRYALPLTVLGLLIALVALGFGAKGRGGLGPFLVGVLGSALVITGKFVLDLEPVWYGGISLLVAASVWNAWPKKQRTGRCPACVPTAAALVETGNTRLRGERNSR